MSDVWLFFTHFFHRAPEDCENRGFTICVVLFALYENLRSRTGIENAFLGYHSLTTDFGMARVEVSYPGSLLHPVQVLQELSRLDDDYLLLGHLHPQRIAMSHLAYLQSQVEGCLGAEGIFLRRHAACGGSNVRIDLLIRLQELLG